MSRGQGHLSGPEVPCSQPHSDEVAFTWTETASGSYNPKELSDHAYDVCEAMLAPPQRDTSADSPVLMAWFPIQDEWAGATDKGLPVTFACGWHYAHDYTDFASTIRTGTQKQ